jgi:hypothetical protein
MARFIYFEPTDEIFQQFENYEIWPCLVVGRSDTGEIIYETCAFDDPEIAIWCVYGHYHRGGLDCISDHDALREAEEFVEMLPKLIISPF